MSKENITTAIGLAIITIAALLLITPVELIPGAVQQESIPIIGEARRQRASILPLLGSQATLLLILASQSPRGALLIWAAITAALVPFAAGLNQMDKDNPAQNQLVIVTLLPIFIRGASAFFFGKTKTTRMVCAALHAAALIGVPTILGSTKLGPIIALTFGLQATIAAMVVSILIGILVFIILILAAGAIAVGRATRLQ